jgi:hypothetical protein
LQGYGRRVQKAKFYYLTRHLFHYDWKAGKSSRVQKYAICFNNFPFPIMLPTSLTGRIRAEGEALDALRKLVLMNHPDLTLTKLYNVLEAVRTSKVLTDEERDIHDRGLVSVMRQHHGAIDQYTAQAYGWSDTLPDEEILARLVALNRERAAEEAVGNILWLRPDLHAPRQAAAVAKTLDLGEAPLIESPPALVPWPKSLPEQVTAVAKILGAAPRPLSARELARAFHGKRASSIQPVLEALAAVGQARSLADGRFAT